MLVGTSQQLKRIGIRYENANFFCCTDSLVEAGKCNVSDSIAFPADMDPFQNNGTMYYFPISFGLVNNSLEGGIGPYRINITVPGIWYLLVVNCNDHLKDDSTTVRLIGTSVWMNPFGYLPGQLYGQMPVYWTLTILYFIFFVSWCISCICHGKASLHPVQYSLIVVLAVSWLENMIWGSAFVRYNFDGVNNNIWNAFGTFFLAMKLTLSRTMLLLICMGYSITHVSIPRQQQFAVMGLSLIYFIVVAAGHFVTVLQDHGYQISYASKMLLVFLNALISATMFCWIFASLHWTREELRQQGEAKKSKMYRALSISVGLAFAVSAIIFIAEFITQLMNLEDKLWKSEFFFVLYWEFAFFFILIAVAIIWRPVYENFRYAHVEDNKPNAEEMHQIDFQVESK